MKTVPAIIKTVYGKDIVAAKALKIGRSVVANWKFRAYFPSHILPRILSDAAAKGVALSVADIPLIKRKPTKAAA